MLGTLPLKIPLTITMLSQNGEIHKNTKYTFGNWEVLETARPRRGTSSPGPIAKWREQTKEGMYWGKGQGVKCSAVNYRYNFIFCSSSVVIKF